MDDIAREDQNSPIPAPSSHVSGPIKEGAPLPESDLITSSETSHGITPELSELGVEESPVHHELNPDQIQIKDDRIQNPQTAVPMITPQEEIGSPLPVNTAIKEAANPDKTRSKTWLGAIIEKALYKFRQKSKALSPTPKPD